jgi:uncharacterized protein (TIGR02597 family)
MRKLISCFVLLVANAVFLQPVLPQSATSEPVGFTTTSLLSNSDTLISIPFTRLPEFTGAVQTVTGNVITVAGTPGWITNQFVYAVGLQSKTYFVLIGEGVAPNPKEGHSYLVTANGPSTLAVDTSTDTLSGITAGTRVIVIPYWTPATIFPPSDVNLSFTATTSTSSYKTQLLVPDNTASGTSLPTTTYFFSNNVNGTPNNIGWRVVGSNTTNRGDDPLPLSGHLVVRNLNGSPTLPLKGIGGVLMKKFATPLRALAAKAQDNAVSMIRPIDVTLNQTGLNPNDGSFSVKDSLFLFDNSVAAFDKQPSAVYYYAGGQRGGWRLVDDPLGGDHGDDVIPAGSAMLIRKADSATTVFWINAPTY